jgi:hypothetical protein
MNTRQREAQRQIEAQTQKRRKAEGQRQRYKANTRKGEERRTTETKTRYKDRIQGRQKDEEEQKTETKTRYKTDTNAKTKKFKRYIHAETDYQLREGKRKETYIRIEGLHFRKIEFTVLHTSHFDQLLFFGGVGALFDCIFHPFLLLSKDETGRRRTRGNNSMPPRKADWCTC